jgi:hypothetical protein
MQKNLMGKIIPAVTATLLLGASGYALAESARPQSSTSGSSSSTSPSAGTEGTSFPHSGAAGSQPQSGNAGGTSDQTSRSQNNMSGQTSEPQTKQPPEQRR